MTDTTPVDTTTAETPDTTEATDTTPQDATHAPQTPDEAEVEHEADEAQHGREAARYRRKLREVETERDTLRAEVDTLRRAAVAAVIKAEKRQGTVALLDAAGVALDTLLDDSGVVDTAKVLAALDAAGQKLGVPVRLPAAPPAVGQGNVGRSIYDGKPEPRFADAFRPR